MATDDHPTAAGTATADDLEKASLDAVYQKLGTSAKGLTTGEAHQRLEQYGRNELVEKETSDLVPKSVWSQRYEHINNFEEMLYDNGTHILKFYLHIDPEEQLERFKTRIVDPARHWKISEGDYAERPFWDAYSKAFEDALSKCSTEHAPWFIIPSNHKWFRNLAISKIVSETLESLNMKFPAPTVDINEIKKKYHAIVEAEGGGQKGKKSKKRKAA